MTYNQDQLKQAFEAVQNKDDWKEPIDAYITANDIEVTREAVVHFTATEAKIEYDAVMGMYHVTAKGYRNGPAW